jgi:hypothetical protein
VILLLPGFVCSAIGFTVQWREQWLPAAPTNEKLWKGIPPAPAEVVPLLKWTFHFLKNFTTETYRADCEWWSKFTAFTILVETALLVWRW